jgi:hypothetical protein
MRAQKTEAEKKADSPRGAAQAATRAAGPTAGPLSAEAALTLQRSVGNQRMSRALGEGSHARGTGLAVQRAGSGSKGKGKAKAAETEQASSQLHVAHLAEEQEGPCGYFVRERQWSIHPPRGGLIIQKVTRTFHNVHRLTDDNEWVAMSNGDIDRYVTSRSSQPYAATRQYWELWKVDSKGNITDTGIDTFGLCSIIPPKCKDLTRTTAGGFTIEGNAQFYAYADKTVKPDALGFRRNSVNAAGELFASGSSPTSKINKAITDGELIAQGSPVHYRATSTWNCADGDGGYSVIT